MKKINVWLSGLSFRTGTIVLLSCLPFYAMSGIQFLLPISIEAKGILWIILFGMAKTAQYAGLAILGVDGYRRLKLQFASWRKKQE